MKLFCNRFLRLIWGIVITIIELLIFQSFSNNNVISSDLVSIGMMISVLGLAYQILGDLLSSDILNWGPFLFIKRVLFIIGTLFLYLMYFVAIQELENVDLSVYFSRVLNYWPLISAIVFTFAWVILTTQYFDGIFVSFYTIGAIAASFLLSLIIALIVRDLKFAKIVFYLCGIASVPGMIYYSVKTEEWVFGAFVDCDEPAFAGALSKAADKVSSTFNPKASEYIEKIKQSDGSYYYKCTSLLGYVNALAKEYSSEVKDDDHLVFGTSCMISFTPRISTNHVTFKVRTQIREGKKFDSQYSLDNFLRNIESEVNRRCEAISKRIQNQPIDNIEFTYNFED